MPTRRVFQVTAFAATLAILGVDGCASKQAAYTGKVLVLTRPMPPDIEHEVIGKIDVAERGFGGIADAFRALGDKGREVGANAIVDARVWLAPAFPSPAAPHGKGVAVRVKDPKKLQELVEGRWE